MQVRAEPTRDVYVVRDHKGDREFAGFGRPTHEYSDAFLEADKLPLADIQVWGGGEGGRGGCEGWGGTQHPPPPC